MPELPEVETIVQQLQTVLPGKVIDSIEVLKNKSFDYAQDKSFLVGKKIVSVTRKQKIIVVELTDDLVVLVHLKMTGQLIYENDPTSSRRGGTSWGAAGQLIYEAVGSRGQGSEKKEKRIVGGHPLRLRSGQAVTDRIVGGHPTRDWIHELPSKHTRVIFHFSDGSILYFNDQRLFGWVRIVNRQEWVGYRDGMAPDVVDDAFTVDYLSQVLRTSGRAVKLVILDQDKIGGMGNIYANDALYLAGIHPKMPANQLKMHAVIKLHEAMKQVIEAGITAGGASYSHFVDTKGLGGHYQDQFLVYDREGQPCRACHTNIQKISLGGRGTYFCPQCQR